MEKRLPRDSLRVSSYRTPSDTVTPTLSVNQPQEEDPVKRAFQNALNQNVP